MGYQRKPEKRGGDIGQVTGEGQSAKEGARRL